MIERVRPTRLRLLSFAVAVGCLTTLGAPAARADTVAYTTPGEYPFTVPVGVSSLHVLAIAGNGAGAGAGHGLGAAATGDLAVTAGETLYLEVGGNGSFFAGGANGGGDGGHSNQSTAVGGGGGGASDIRTVPVAGPGPSLESRLLVAGGGGGAPATGIGAGGNGGGPTGTDGIGDLNPPGHGGTQTEGGSGAPGCGSAHFGELGSGGHGGDPGLDGPNAGGGGGGGLYGGGGGGCDAGGGGGSGYFGPRTSATSVLTGNGNPSITLTYTIVTPPPTPDPGNPQPTPGPSGPQPSPTGGGSTPSNSFTLGKAKCTAAGTVCQLSISVPGSGELIAQDASATKTKTQLITKTTAKVAKAGKVTLKFRLTSAGRKALKKHKGRLSVKIKITFKPTGGAQATKTIKVTFKKKK